MKMHHPTDPHPRTTGGALSCLPNASQNPKDLLANLDESTRLIDLDEDTRLILDEIVSELKRLRTGNAASCQPEIIGQKVITAKANLDEGTRLILDEVVLELTVRRCENY